jgi:uroporphyrinogen-III decarboxylase
MMVLSARENLLRAIRHDEPEWVPSAWEAVALIGPPVFERCWAEGRDDFGVHWSYEAGAEGGTYPTLDGHPIRDLSRWREQIAIPDVDAMEWDAVAERAARIDRDQYLLCAFIEMGLFERSYLLLGMSEALMGYVAEPDLMYELLGALANYKIRLIERFDDVADLDMVWYGDDWGTQDRLFLRPTVWRQIIRPQTQRLYDAMKRRSLLINQHSCGRIEAIFEDVVDMGADIWNPCQPCNDLAALKQQYGGRITFCGGIDSQFVLNRPGATPEEVRAEVRRRIDQMAAGGGYIAAPSHSVPTDPALIDAMNDEISSYGRRSCARPSRR